MKAPSRNMMIGYDVTDPTVWEEEFTDDTVIGECAVCGKEICYGDRDIHVVNRNLMCGNCHDFRKLTPGELFNMIHIEPDTYTGRELVNEVIS